MGRDFASPSCSKPSAAAATRITGMSEQRPRVISVGEALIELVRGGDGRFGLSCSGDTFNVAVYLARAGIDSAFATALGDDPYSEAIVAPATAEGVAGDLMLRMRGRLPGLAEVDSDTAGGGPQPQRPAR